MSSDFQEFLNDNKTTTFKALSEMDVVDLNLRVSQLRNELNDIASRLDNFAADLAYLSGRLNAIQSEIDSVLSIIPRITTLETTVTALETTISYQYLQLTSRLTSLETTISSISSEILSIQNIIADYDREFEFFHVDLNALWRVVENIQNSTLWITRGVPATVLVMSNFDPPYYGTSSSWTRGQVNAGGTYGARVYYGESVSGTLNGEVATFYFSGPVDNIPLDSRIPVGIGPTFLHYTLAAVPGINRTVFVNVQPNAPPI